MPSDRSRRLTSSGDGLSPAQERVVDHERGALLVVGAAATGKSEALIARLCALVERGSGPDRVRVIARGRAASDRLRAGADRILTGPREELSVSTWDGLCEEILRRHAEAAGLDPFFEVVEPAERLAMMVDRFERLPLRHHDIRGNPAGLLTGLLARIDRLRESGATASSIAAEASRLAEDAAAGGDRAAAEEARRGQELAELITVSDELLAECGCLARSELAPLAGELLASRPDVRARVAAGFDHLIIDELEDMSEAGCRVLAGLAEGADSIAAALNDDQALEEAGLDAAERFDRVCPDSSRIVLSDAFRLGGAGLDAARAVLSGTDQRIEKPWRAAGEETSLRFWRCANDRAQAQVVAREVEHAIADGLEPERVAVVLDDTARHGPAVVVAMQERGVSARVSGATTLFRLPEVRDTVAWLRVLADPTDAAAATRALTRPPVELRPVELAKLTVIARRRKLDMVSACEAALESPQMTPEARERIQGFLKLYGAASSAMEKRRPDAFVRRLIDRIGLRRQRLFAARAETAERLLGLSHLAEIASSWSRREPRGSNRDFVRFLSALADAGPDLAGADRTPPPGSVPIISADEAKGCEFERVFILGMDAGFGRRRRALAAAITSSRTGPVLSRVEAAVEAAAPGRGPYEEVLAVLGGIEEVHEEQLFGPAEDLHATYRMMRDEVLESSWKAGRALSEPRLDVAVDVNRAVARYLELLKLAALAQRSDGEAGAESIKAINGLLSQVANSDQRSELERSTLDAFLLEAERERGVRERLLEAREEPSLEAFLPRRGDGLRLSATDLDLYLTCPLKYKFARVFGIPKEPTVNQRFGILIHNVLERYHRDGEEGLDRLLGLLEAGWRRSGLGDSNDELQFRDRARRAMRSYWERESASEAEPVWLERSFEFGIGPHHLRGRVDRVDRLPGGSFELIDYKTGLRKSESDLAEDVQLALYRVAAREAWDVDAASGSYYYVLDGDKVAVEAGPGDAERVEQVVMDVGDGVMSQDFEPRPSPEVCSWCDFRLICPAAEV